MKNLLLKSAMMAFALFLSVNCFAESPMLYVYDYTYDVRTKESYDVYGYKDQLIILFSDDNSRVYSKSPKSKEYGHPYYYIGRQNGWIVYQRKDFRADGIPYYPTLAFSENYKVMTFDFGDHTAFNTRNYYHWVIK